MSGEVKAILNLPGNLELQDLIDNEIFLGDLTYKLEDAFWMNKTAILKFDKINSLEDAEKIRGKAIYSCKDQIGELPANEFFLEDLLGLQAADQESGSVIGSIDDFDDIPGNPLVKIKPIDGPVFLLPFNEEFVKEINLKQKKIHLNGWKIFLT